MSENVFRLAKRETLKLRICLYGLSGSGKTLGALRVAYGLCGDWGKVALIDADNYSSLGYVNDPVTGVGQFLFAPLDAPFTPKRYLDLLKVAVETGAEVIIIDTLSQEWAGEGGIIEQHDRMPGNSYMNWGKVNPAHNELINWMTHKCPAHLIVNFRAKMKHAMIVDEQTGKNRIEKLSDGPIMRPGTEYEFLLALECTRDTYRAGIITKRGSMLPDMSPIELTVELGQKLAIWAESGIASLESGKLLLVSQLKDLYPDGGKEVAAALKQLGLTYSVELHNTILVALTNAKMAVVTPNPMPNNEKAQQVLQAA